MGDPQADILNPRSIVIPDYTDIDISTAEKGMLFISAAKLYFVDAVGGFEKVTSA